MNPLSFAGWFPEDVSLDGHRIDDLFWFTTYEVTIYFFIVVAALLWFVYRYRAREGHKAEYFRGDKKKNILVTVALGLVVFVTVDMNLVRRSIADYNEAFGKFPKQEDALRIEVFGRQFNWFFRYAGADGKFGNEDDILQGDIFIPVDKPVIFELKAREVIHSLFLPHFRIKADTIPGRITAMWVQAKKTGTYDVACAELCGLGHYQMKAKIHIVTADEWEKWMDERIQEDAEYELFEEDENWGWDWVDLRAPGSRTEEAKK